MEQDDLDTPNFGITFHFVVWISGDAFVPYRLLLVLWSQFPEVLHEKVRRARRSSVELVFYGSVL